MKIGIVADNYKLDRFKKELTKKGFADFELFPFTEGTTTIRVNTEPGKANEVKKICELIELHFKHSN